ncbi:MAG TPA: hypothetical protein VF648_15830 [Pyrinomonadaceae bacterium]|jgi:hypothetical protein
MLATKSTLKESPVMLDMIDHANVSPATAKLLANGNFPPFPTIGGLMWRPPQQSDSVVQGTTTNRLMIFAAANTHSYTQYVPDTPGATLLDYWDGQGAAQYTLTMRSYWVLIPGSYTQVIPGDSYENSYTTTSGISTSASQTLTAELNAGVEGLSATLTAEFAYTVDTSVTNEQTRTYTVSGPTDGLTKVWMLWQLIDELVALDSNGLVVANPTRMADIDWDGHNASGAYVHYTDLDQHFPTTIIVPVQMNFPSES